MMMMMMASCVITTAQHRWRIAAAIIISCVIVDETSVEFLSFFSLHFKVLWFCVRKKGRERKGGYEIVEECIYEIGVRTSHTFRSKCVLVLY